MDQFEALTVSNVNFSYFNNEVLLMRLNGSYIFDFRGAFGGINELFLLGNVAVIDFE